MEVLYNVAGGVILKLASSTVNEVGQWLGFTDELEKLTRTVSTVEAVILHAEEQSMENPQVKHWLGLLSEALYDAEDLLDEISYEALRKQVMGGSDFSNKVRRFFSSSNQLHFRRKMGYKVRALREKFDEIAAEKNKFHLEERSVVARPFVPNDRYQTHSSPPQVVIGREPDKEKVVELLRSFDCDENVSVAAIVGIGGLGKTTLAQMVYNDGRVKRHFELKMWVCVSDDFDVKLLVKNVIESASRQAPSSTQMDVLKNQLHEKINGKRYLLVLDDVWNQDVNTWSSFIDLFANGAKGSKILITTRSPRVAETSRVVAIHELGGLPKEECWSLFKQVAFNQRHQLNPSWEAIGKKIVKKCRGVPLAIKAIAGVLYSKDPDTEWGPFKDDELSKIDVFKKDIEPILRLSYDHLRSPYKRCFAYCCLFPKGSKISVDMLIQLWKAQGYVQPTNPSESLHDVGLKYFKDLLQLSFFQDVKEDRLGNIMYCKMHDLMHDLAVSVAGNGFSVSAPRQITSIKRNIQHMSFCDASSFLKMRKVRTILKLSHERMVFEQSEFDAVFSKLRCLRVLDLSGIWSSTLQNSIYKMKLLRYLNLSHNDNIKKLPKSLVNLHNLQGLNLERCHNLRKWPSDMSKLVNLTDLNFDDCPELNYIPSGIGKLTKLEKLSKFVIAEDQSISKHSARLDELHSLYNLRGELKIKNLRFVEYGTSEFREGLLISKKNLKKLKLDWGNDYANNVGDQEMVMEALCPHPNLKALEVHRYGGLKPPSWLPSITNLVEVTFSSCSNIQRLSPFDQLIHLQKLYISKMLELESIEVEYVGVSSSFFPSLTHLTLCSCPKLKGFERLSSLPKEELPCFPCLSDLTIRDSPNLIHLPLSTGVEMWDFDADVELSSDRLVLSNYRGLTPPSWLPSIINLVEVTIQKCSSIQKLPPLDQLLHLKKLNISDMSELESIAVEYGGGSCVFFPFLTDLALLNCPKLKGFERLSSLSVEKLRCFPCLSKLSIHGCPDFIFLPLSPGVEMWDFDGDVELSSKSLVVSNCRGLKPPSWLLSITNLKKVSIQHCSNIQRLPPFHQLLHLQELCIYHMSEIETIEVEYGGGSSSFFPSLTFLTLCECPKLKGFERLSSVSEEELPCFPRLSNLYISGCPNLIFFPLSTELEILQLKGVESLYKIRMMPKNSAFTLSKFQELSISGMEDCTEDELNDWMQWQSFEVLRRVEFRNMKNMVSLPKGLEHATTLQGLHIYGCPRFECIPEWMTNLIGLQYFTIECSPKVEERCNNNSSEDWHKVSHIPNILIEGTQIQWDGRYLL